MRWATRIRPGIVSIIALGSLASDADAGPFVQGDLLVARERYPLGPTLLHEYTPAGVRVQTITVTNDQQQEARGVAVDLQGRAVVYYGTFNPTLWVYDPATGASTTRTFDGWSSINSIVYGGLAAYGRYVFATDMSTSGAEADGIIRFDMLSGQAQRINGPAPSNNYRQLAVGYDGLLYAMEGGTSPEPGTVDVYDPNTTAYIRSFGLSVNASSIAVGAAGDIFAVQQDGFVFHLDSQGNEIKRLDVSAYGGLHDLFLSSTGKIAIASHAGFLLETDTSLTGYTEFHAGYNDTNNSLGNTNTQVVTFVQTPIPEPGGLLFAGTVWALISRRTRHDRARRTSKRL